MKHASLISQSIVKKGLLEILPIQLESECWQRHLHIDI